jgi:hypothetical protein
MSTEQYRAFAFVDEGVAQFKKHFLQAGGGAVGRIALALGRYHPCPGATRPEIQLNRCCYCPVWENALQSITIRVFPAWQAVGTNYVGELERETD